MLVYFYDGGRVLVFLAVSVLAWKIRTFPLILAAVCLFAFVLGTHYQSVAQRVYVEAQQTMQDQSGIVFEFYVWRVISSLGSLLGSASLLWFAVKNNGSKLVEVNNP